MYVKDLETLKYSELRKLAKSVGIKANQKVEKLIQALKNYYIENDIEDVTDKDALSSAQTSASPQKLTSPKEVKSNCELQTAVNSAQTSNAVTSKENKVPRKRRTVESENQLTDLGTSKSGKLEDAQVVSAAATPESKVPRKRRRTFELDTPTLGFNNTPSSDGPKRPVQDNSRNGDSHGGPQKKRIRRNTFNKDSPKNNEDEATRTSSSPGTKAIIDSLSADLSSPERKEIILNAIDKKIQQEKESQPSQIPRYITYLANKKLENQQQTGKPTTPGNKNWTKIHSKEFSKFDSLDVYLEKKHQRMESLTGSAKAASATQMSRRLERKIIKPVVRPTRQNVQPIKSQSFHVNKTPNTEMTKVQKKPSKNQSLLLNKTPSTNQKETKVQAKPFVPTVTSVKNLSFNFLKSPLPKGANSENKDVSLSKPSHGQTTTPFKFTGNTTCLNGTESSKKSFDLKASLAKPLTWKPHTGKLQPFDNKTSIAVIPKRPSRQALATKTRPVQAKEIQRVQQLDRRNNQKYIDMMRRRGLMN
ncbi:nucleolar and spindle-associated protein 1-like isoform X2 [Biomphalaria glabrata]|uniref:Nucleolar and spindle-associated protein 1-like isoform X2 n=1 Tax=Biomphalaria glabrata TaxID=6526 RepID=A0A9W2ZUI9_BIOGL|nr:nucleolar and spindle-associated protein 1-like isoform X2 [Biomphalaria glabrata]